MISSDKLSFHIILRKRSEASFLAEELSRLLLISQFVYVNDKSILTFLLKKLKCSSAEGTVRSVKDNVVIPVDNGVEIGSVKVVDNLVGH